jgi:hypothetical protein
MTRFTYTAGEVQRVEFNIFTAGIDVEDSEANKHGTPARWWSKIEIHGSTLEEATIERDRILVLILRNEETAK